MVVSLCGQPNKRLFAGYIVPAVGLVINNLVPRVCLHYLTREQAYSGNEIGLLLEVTIARKLLPHPQGMAPCAIC
jgi:hypothetical protein